MSILYLRVNSIDNNGNIANWSLKNSFTDETELAKWFAYDYTEKGDIEYNYCRYANLIKNQRLCKNDVYSIGYETVSKYINGVLRNIDIPTEQYPRTYVLYDEDTDRFLDIRNYKNLIKHHINNGICDTEWILDLRKKEVIKYRGRQGRSHHKDKPFRKTGLFKDSLSRTYRNRIDNEELTEFNIICNIPLTYRPKIRRERWEESCATVENNWKSKKCRHQWQWHKPFTNCRAKELRQYKGCEDYLSSDEDYLASDCEIE